MRVQVKFEPRDLWVGVYWTWEAAFKLQFEPEGNNWFEKLVIYVCILPTLPIIIVTDIEKP